jgi:hypothetical protein
MRRPALSRKPVFVTVGDFELIVPWRSAREWIEAIGVSGHLAVLRVAQNPDDVVVSMAAGQTYVPDVRNATRHVLSELTGRRWFIAQKLIMSGADGELLGELVLSGVDPDRIGVAEWCAAVYRILVRNADPKRRATLDFELAIPPEGEEESWDDGSQFDPAALAAFVQSQGG